MMEKRVFIEFISAIVPLAPSIREVLREQLRPENLKAGQILLKEGQVCRRIHFIIRGLVHTWHTVNERPYTSRFSGKSELVFSSFSFYNQVSSTENISVIQDGISLSLSYEQIESLQQESPQFERLIHLLKQSEDSRREKEFRLRNHLSARERLRKLLNKFPDIIKQAGLKKVASYLNITHEALSRMKKKLAQNDSGQYSEKLNAVNLIMQEPDQEHTGIERLVKLLEAKTSLPQGLKNFHEEHLVPLRFNKLTKLISPDRVADAAWYLESGLAKEYYYDKEGREIVTAFWKENEIIMYSESLFERTLPTRYIELIEDSKLLSLSYEHLLEAYRNWNEAHALTRHIQIEDKRKSEFRAEIVTLPAAEKYALFCKEFPWHRISSKDICSYLHMAPQTLSQLRGHSDTPKLP